MQVTVIFLRPHILDCTVEIDDRQKHSRNLGTHACCSMNRFGESA